MNRSASAHKNCCHESVLRERRKILVWLSAASLLAPLRSLAQPKTKVWQVGFLYFGSRQSAVDLGRYQQFEQGMRELGYEEGRNFSIAARFADSNPDNVPRLAAELVRLNVDVIVATGAPVYSALQRANINIPTVVTVASDPTATGLAKTLARPGGNFTGLSENNAELVTKHVELLRLAVPNLTRLAVLTNPSNPAAATQIKRIQAVTQGLGITFFRVQSANVEGNAQAFATISRERVEAMIILNDTFFVQQSRQLAQLAIKHRLASIFGTQDYARAGGLMSYGPEVKDHFRRAAAYVDKIFKGAKPGDLPIEQPTRYLLTINRKTAKAIGREIPSELSLRADKVID
jgi:putative ABC transport system substrate-binding protein